MNNNGDSGDNSNNVNEFAPKPQVHVSIEGTEHPDKIRGGPGNDIITGEKGDDNLQGNEGDDELKGGEGDDEIDGGDGDDIVNGESGKDKLKGGKGADHFVCDKEDKIVDYNSLENDIIEGDCEYEDKGVVPEPIPEKEIPKQNQERNTPLFPNSAMPSNKDDNFERAISKLFDKNIIRIFP